MGKKKVSKEEVEDESHSDEDETSKKPVSKSEKGWNWKALIIMLMFILPALLAVVIQVNVIFDIFKSLR